MLCFELDSTIIVFKVCCLDLTVTNDLNLITLPAWLLSRKKSAEILENSTTHEMAFDLQEISFRALFSHIVPVQDEMVHSL